MNSGGVQWLISQLQRSKDWHRVLNEVSQMGSSEMDIIQQAKEVEKNNMCEFAAEFAEYEREQSKRRITGAMVSMCAWTFFKNRRE